VGGDFDQDQLSDLALDYAGGVLVFYGSSLSASDLSADDANVDIAGPSAGAQDNYFPFPVADVTGDGLDDLVVTHRTTASSGSVDEYWGEGVGGGWTSGRTMASDGRKLVLAGGTPSMSCGSTLLPAEIGGDGVPALFFADPGADSCRGAVYVVDLPLPP